MKLEDHEDTKRLMKFMYMKVVTVSVGYLINFTVDVCSITDAALHMALFLHNNGNLL